MDLSESVDMQRLLISEPQLNIGSVTLEKDLRSVPVIELIPLNR
jgi:hypothetical protein